MGLNPFFSTKVKVICQDLGQISRSVLKKKMANMGAFMFHKHILFFFFPETNFILRDNIGPLSNAVLPTDVYREITEKVRVTVTPLKWMWKYQHYTKQHMVSVSFGIVENMSDMQSHGLLSSIIFSNLFPNKSWFLLVCSTNLLNTRAISPFPTVFSTLFKNFL